MILSLPSIMHDKLYVSISFPDQTLISFGIHFEITENCLTKDLVLNWFLVTLFFYTSYFQNVVCQMCFASLHKSLVADLIMTHVFEVNFRTVALRFAFLKISEPS